MSTIQLTDQLLNDIQEALHRHDEQTKDIGVGIQYLAALLGFLVSRYPVDEAQQRDVLRQLYEFAAEVLEQNSSQQSAPGADEAFGIWKPE